MYDEFITRSGLEKAQYVSKCRATGKYTAGQELSVPLKRIDRHMYVTTITKPFLNSLSKRINRTVCLSIKDEDRIRIKGVTEASGFTISSSLVTRLPLGAGAPGNSLLNY